MRYIDKYRMHAAAHDINVKFLKDCYADDIHTPLPSPANSKSSYEDFKKPKYRDGVSGWKNLLLEEQTSEGHPRCCYCMRRLNPSASKINYEHIIPRSLSGTEGQEQYAYYSSHAPALHAHVIMADEFEKKSFASTNAIEGEDKMPHITALSNLAVACNGTRDTFNTTGCCCNGNRKDNKILPIMLMEQACTEVKYDQNGIMSISCNDGTLSQMIDELNSDTFKEIRSVWYHLSRVSKDISNALTMPMKERIEWFKSAYSTTNFATLKTEVRRYSGFGEKDNADTYWKLLLAYDWFYYYPNYAKQRATT